MEEVCTLCPRQCRALRTETSGDGLCGMPAWPVLARAALHHGEEPCLSGTRGAGAVFFSGCPLRCVYCQNESISQERFGKAVSPTRLRTIFEELIAAGAHTLDLVNPTHFFAVLEPILRKPLAVPVVWNSSGYESVERLQRLEGCVDIYLPDFKYPDAEGARRYSGVADYPTVAKAAIVEMVRQTGAYRLNEEGLLQGGVLLRHLLLPGRLREAKLVMDWVAETFPPGHILVSLMGQYTPLAHAAEYPPLDRPLRGSELRAAVAYMQALGLEGYTQDTSAAKTEYVPAFDLCGVDKTI